MKLTMTLLEMFENSDIHQCIFEQGEAKGIEKGKVEGEILGRLAEARYIITRQGTKRLGEPSQAAKDELASLADISRLERIAVRLLGATDWNDLLATP
jgi:predicted transposase YdaD